MSEQLKQHINNFKQDYLAIPAGQKHLAIAETEAAEVQELLDQIWAKYQMGDDITEDVLDRLLPHADTAFHRENNYRISTWPCITKDVRKWFEAKGWKTPDQWPETARLILEAVHGLVNGDLAAWQAFIDSPYRHGFGTGFISPILYCLDQQYPVINSKVVKTYRYCTTQLGKRDDIDAGLADYLENRKKVLALQKQLAPLGLETIQEFDTFCHYMVSKRLGGGDLTKSSAEKSKELPAVAWLFVANPEIYHWETAFDDGIVDWTGSKGAYAQKLIRERMKPGDRVFGYQAGPVYEIVCELKVKAPSYKTSEGTWAVDLEPVRRFTNTVALSTLKGHPQLSQIKFVQQTQMSISGISAEQLLILEGILSETEDLPELPLTPLTEVDKLCTELEVAQFDTKNPDRFEKAIADAFGFLGFEAEHIGGPGNTDVLLVATLGSDTYSVVADAKTCQRGAKLSQQGYRPIESHKEQNTADFALFVAPAYAGGNTESYAVDAGVSLITTATLIRLLRWHDHIPFTLHGLRRIFAKAGIDDRLTGELGRAHVQQDEMLQLVSRVLQIYEKFQRQNETSLPILAQSIVVAMQIQESNQESKSYNTQEVEAVLGLLSNRVLNILQKEPDGYVLTLPVEAAAKRISALAQVISADPNITAL